MADEADIKEIGSILKAISNKDVIKIQTLPPTDEDIVAGWTFYATLSDKEGGLRLKPFVQLFCTCAEMIFEIDEIASRSLNYVKRQRSALIEFFNGRCDSNWDEAWDIRFQDEIRLRCSACYPLAAKVLFRYFGEDDYYVDLEGCVIDFFPSHKQT